MTDEHDSEVDSVVPVFETFSASNFGCGLFGGIFLTQTLISHIPGLWGMMAYFHDDGQEIFFFMIYYKESHKYILRTRWFWQMGDVN